jgi:hypothetical protein
MNAKNGMPTASIAAAAMPTPCHRAGTNIPMRGALADDSESMRSSPQFPAAHIARTEDLAVANRLDPT